MDAPLAPIAERMRSDETLKSVSRALHDVLASKPVSYVAGNHDAGVTDAEVALLLGADKEQNARRADSLSRLDSKVLLMHGCHHDLFNAPDPKSRAMPLGYYVTRLDCTKPIKDAVGPVCGMALMRAMPPRVWDVMFDVMPDEFMSEQVVSGMLKRDGIADTALFAEHDGARTASLASVREEYKTLLMDWEGCGGDVSQMIKASAGDHDAFVVRDAAEHGAKAVVYGHTHLPTIKYCSDKPLALIVGPDETNGTLYVNDGSWIYDGKRTYSTFLDIFYDPREGGADAGSAAFALMKWDGAKCKATVLQDATIKL
jgi:UDP-2,3-diacylglucosamine pyrophosphatase LpxH